MLPTTQKPKDMMHPRRSGSLGYQLLQVLKAIFRPGYSRHQAKRSDTAAWVINGKETLRKYTAQAFEFARFLKTHYPHCQRPEDIEPEMCAAFVESLVAHGLAGGTLGRYLAFIRKLDGALRHLDKISKDAPRLAKAIGEQNVLDRGCIFKDRASLPGHVRAEIRRACRVLGIRPLGSHGFRKCNAQAKYAELRSLGRDDEATRL